MGTNANIVDSRIRVAESINGWMTTRELRIIYNKASRIAHGGKYVEVGVWKGRSFMAAGLAMPPAAMIVGVDDFSGDDSDMHKVTREAPEFIKHCATATVRYLQDKGKLASLLCQSSANASKMFAKKSIDAVFIDGSHDLENVLQDLQLWWPAIKDGGLLFGHDYTRSNKGVVQAVRKFAKSIDVKVTVAPQSTIWILNK